MPTTTSARPAAPAVPAPPAPAADFERLATVRMGEHRGQPRVWLEATYLLRAGFAPGTLIRATFSAGRVVLEPSAEGTRKVSKKARRGADIPVIDLNSAELRAALGEARELQIRVAANEIVITPARTAAKRQTRCRAKTEFSLFAGGGLLTKAAEMAGYRNVGAVELEERYAEVFQRNFPDGKLFNMSIAEVPLAELPTHVGCVTLGIPCEPYSRARTRDRGTGEKRDRALPPEAHPSGDLVFWALRIIDHLNPALVVAEEVPGFADAGAGWIFRHALERMGYTVDARVLDPHDYGELTGRRRYVLVATADAHVQWPATQPCTRTFGDIMDPADVTDDLWWDEASKPWPFAHWAAQTAKGNGFAPPKLTATSPRVPTLKKRYYAGQGDNFVVAHPTRPDTYRWLTIDEGKRLQGLPADYDLGPSKTVAGEILGQGVVASLFTRVIRAASGEQDLALVQGALAASLTEAEAAAAAEAGRRADPRRLTAEPTAGPVVTPTARRGARPQLTLF